MKDEAIYIINNLSEMKLTKALHYLWMLHGPEKRKEYDAHLKSQKTSGDVPPKRRQSKKKKAGMAKNGKDTS